MAAEIELKKINEYVQECLAITSITGSYVYGIDSNGNSIKIAVEVLASAGTDYSQQIAELTTKCNNNTTLISQLQTALSGKAAAVHSHVISDVANLQTALDGKAAAVHSHVISDVAGLQTSLNGKADAVHSHQQSDISGLPDALAGKAAASHTHAQSDITGLTAALEGKADTDHTHEISDVEGLQNSLANINSRINEIDGGGAGNALRQEDLSTYTDAKSGDVIQNLGDDTAALHKYFIYECTEGSTVKTITAGTRCLRLVQGASEFISDQEVDANTDKFILYYRPTVDGVTYNFFGFATLGDTERAKLVGTNVVTDGGETFQITDVTASGNNITAITLDNGVTLPISGQTPTRSTQALLTFYASNGVEYYGTVGDCTLCSKDIVTNVAGTQSYLIATAPIGTLFGAQTDIFTASEDIVFKSVTWTQRNVQPPTSVASGDNFLTLINDELGVSIDIAYNSSNQHLELKGKNSAVVSYVDMGVFIKDGMLDDALLYTTAEQGVTVEVPYLKFIFNVASGKSVIRVSLKDLVDIYDGANINLTSAFVKAAQYSAPAIGDSMDVAIGKLLKGHEDNAAAISGKQDTLTFDDAPQSGSNRPVTSQGIKSAIDAAVGNVPNALKQKDLTTYTGTDGEIVQHTGATTANYTDGYVYKFDEVPSDYPANTLAVRLNGTITNRDSNPINAAALIGNDRNYVKTTPTPYLTDTSAVWFQFTDRATPAVGDGVVVENGDVFDYGVISEIQEYSTKYYCTINIGERVTHYYLTKQDSPGTKYTFVNNNGQLIISHFANINEEYYLNNPSTSENRTYFVVDDGNAYPVVAEEEWIGNSNLLPTQSGWQRINVQPSSEGAVSDLETRMTAAETAISGKQPSITGAASTITTANLTTSKALISDASGKVAASSVSATELGYLSGTTSNIQQQFNTKASSANTVNGAPLSNSASYFFGVSNSAADATMKEVSIPSITTLAAGQIIWVVPTITTNNIQNATLKLNDFTAYPIKLGNSVNISNMMFRANVPSSFLFDGSYWRWAGIGWDTAYSAMSVAEGTTGTETTSRAVRADYLQQIIHGQIDKFVGTRAMTEDAYWDLVTAGTVQADTLYITYDNDWED